MKETLYKVLGKGGKPYHGGRGRWNTHGKWMSSIKENQKLIPCHRGYHLCKREHLIRWLGPEIWIATYKGERITRADKVVVRKARLVKKFRTWTPKTIRLFLCDCADHVLEFGQDDLMEVIETGRQYARGEITYQKLSKIRDHIPMKAWEYHRQGAMHLYYPMKAVEYATRYVCKMSAGPYYARLVRGPTIEDQLKEKDWQTERLFEYLEGKRG